MSVPPKKAVIQALNICTNTYNYFYRIEWIEAYKTGNYKYIKLIRP